MPTISEYLKNLVKDARTTFGKTLEQMREDFRDIAQPGSVFVLLDGDGKPLEISRSSSASFRDNPGRIISDSYARFIRKTAKLRGRDRYIPDLRFERWDFPDALKIPMDWSRRPEKYYYSKLQPAAKQNGVRPKGKISLRDAVFVLHSGLPLLDASTDHAHLSRRRDYKEFIRHCEQGAWQKYMLGQQGKYTAVQTDAGVMVFTHTKMGNKALNTYLQDCADRFFDPLHSTETLRIFEVTNPSKDVTAKADNYIDRPSRRDERSDNPQLFYSRYEAIDDKLLPPSVLEGAFCTEKYDMRPDFANLDRFTSENPVRVNHENYTIASLLYIAERGYTNHLTSDYFHSFGYKGHFEELAGKIAEAQQARTDYPQASHDFGIAELQRQAKEMARDILSTDFNIRDGRIDFGQRQQPQATVIPLTSRYDLQAERPAPKVQAPLVPLGTRRSMPDAKTEKPKAAPRHVKARGIPAPKGKNLIN